MATDLLRATANERVDLVDFEFLADSGLQANLRHLPANFLTTPAGQRSWILDGFNITNPVGKQVQVAKGRAILGQREGAIVHYGALTVEGDATKTIDMSTLTPNANYGVYVRFEYVDGATGSRIFWNPAGTGSELSQSVSTRRLANWSMRIELTNPGGEWVKIASADNTGGSAVITDERPMYFEGTVDSTYASGWSSDGGGGANDRNADRQLYGIKDLQSFTAAMRQSIEDIRGRGLRRWWDRDIGGMNIGFDDDPVEDRLAVGDVSFNLFHDGTDTMLVFDASNDRIFYDRSANQYLHQIGGTTEMMLAGDGVRVLNGLYVGQTGQAAYNDDGVFEGGLAVGVNLDPDADQIIIADTNFRIDFDGTDPRLVFDDWAGSPDEIQYDRSANEFRFMIAAVEEYGFTATALDMHSNNISNMGNIDGTGDLTIGTITMTGFSVDADGDTSVKSLNVNSGGITNAGAISGATTIGMGGALSGATTIDASGDLTVGSITMTGNIYTTGNIGYDSNDYIDWSNNAYMRVIVNGVEEARFATDGLRVTNGLYVGSASGTPTDNDIYAEADITAAGIVSGASLQSGDFYADTNYCRFPQFQDSSPTATQGHMFEWRPPSASDTLPTIWIGAGATGGVNLAFAKVRTIHKIGAAQTRTTNGSFGNSFYSIPNWAMDDGSRLSIKAFARLTYGVSGSVTPYVFIGMSGSNLNGSPMTSSGDIYVEAHFKVNTMGTGGAPGTGYRCATWHQNGTQSGFATDKVQTDSQQTAGDGSYTNYFGVSIGSGHSMTMYHAEWELIV